MNRSDSSTSRTLLIAGLLTALAAVPRLVNLDRLSFYADEDLSALVSHSVARGDGHRLPSGLEYRRGLPLTGAMALSERLFGEGREWVYRLPAAIFGILSVPILFLFGRRLAGEAPAVVAGLLLALSGWHLGFSRQARMYAPLVFTVILGTWALWSWCRSGRWRELAAGLAVGVLGVFLHRGGMIIGLAPLVWLAFPGATAVPGATIVLVALGMSALGFAISEYWTLAPYSRLTVPGSTRRSVPADTFDVTGAPAVDVPTLVGAALGVVLGYWLAHRLFGEARRQKTWSTLVRWCLCGLTGAMAGMGQVYGAVLAGVLLLVADGRGLASALRTAAGPIGAIAVLLAAVTGWGILDAGLRPGLERAAALPYPHLYTLLQQTPLFFGVFLAACGWTAIAPRHSDGLAASALAAIGLLFAFGVLFDEVPTRYLLPIYPFMLLIVAIVLEHLASRGLDRIGVASDRRRLLAPTGLALVVASGALGDHGIPQTVHLAELRHGEPMNRIAQIFPFRPDHRGPGRAVREIRRPDDVVIAEDPLVQGWYAGRVDYWFRRFEDMRRFLEVRADGSVADIYVGSAPLAEPGRVDSVTATAGGRVWFITSGETRTADSYLTAEQRRWLDSLARAREPVVVGEDGVTALYCLNCPSPAEPPPAPETSDIGGPA